MGSNLKNKRLKAYNPVLSNDDLAIKFASYPMDEWIRLIAWREDRGINSDELIQLRQKGKNLLSDRIRKAKSKSDPELSLADQVLKGGDDWVV